MKAKRIVSLLGAIFLGVFVQSIYSAEDNVIYLKFSHQLSPLSYPNQNFIVPWCDRIKEESSGRLQCQIYPSMQLGGTPAQLINQAKEGIADVSWSIPSYTPGLFPTIEYFELPYVTTSAEASSKALWDYLHAYALDEFSGLKVLASWVNGPNVFHFRGKEPINFDTLGRKKIRAASRQANKIIAALGGTPVGIPGVQFIEAYSKGVIDAVLTPWEAAAATKIHELSTFHVEGDGKRTLNRSVMVLVMNESRYNSLPEDLKKVIDHNSGLETSAWIASVFKKADELGREDALKMGHKIFTLSDQEVTNWMAVTKKLIDEWKEEQQKKGKNGAEMAKKADELIELYSYNGSR